MERSTTLSTPEIVGVAVASAAALGGIIVALGRSQASTANNRVAEMLPVTVSRPSLEHVERGRELARSAVASLSASYPDLRDSAVELIHRAADTARPQASRVTASASSTADQVRSTGATVLERLQADVIPAAADAFSGLVERADDARSRSQPVASEMKAVAVTKADKALTKSTSAAKDTMATIMWIAAALTLVYVALLTPERREQLKGFLWGVYDQTQVLFRDFQGYEEEF